MKVLLLFVAVAVSSARAEENLCNLCVDGLSEVKVMFADKQFQSLLDTTQSLICAYVPIEDCQNWITQQLEALDNDVETLDPKSYCTQQGVCTTRNVGDYKCNFCELLGDELKQLLRKNETENFILDSVKKVCVDIPLIGSECGSLIDEYGIYYLDMLMEKINIASICGELGLCNAEVRRMIQATDIFQVVSQRLRDSEGCEACKDGIGMVHEVLQSKEFLDLLHIAAKELLDAIGMSQYESLVDTVIDEAINQYVLPLLDPTTLCKEAGACLTTSIEVEATNLTSDECDACTELLGELKKVSKDPDTGKAVTDLVGVICDNIKIPLCESLLGNLVKEQLIKLQNLDVAGTCSSLGLCAEFKPLLDHIRRVNKLGDTCSECKAIAGEVITILQNEEIDNLIKSGISEICSLIPIANCEQTLDQYFDEVIAIIKNLDGQTVCDLIGLCGSESLKESLPKLGDTCSECTMVANEVIQLLENEEIDSLVKSAIAEICTVLPISNCEQTLDEYFDEIIALVKTLDGKSLCSLIGLCGSSQEVQWY